MLNVSSAGPAIGNLNAFAIWLPNLNQGLGILNPAFSTASGGTTSTGSPALSDWSSNSIDAPLRMASGFDFGAGTQDKHHGNEGICFGAAGGNCWFTPATEYLSFTFEFGSTFGLIDLTGAGAGAKWQSIGSNSGPSFDCAFTSSDATNLSSFGSCSTTTMTTPEPAALVLTATGLLGLGIVARRRKAVA